MDELVRVDSSPPWSHIEEGAGGGGDGLKIAPAGDGFGQSPCEEWIIFGAFTFLPGWTRE